MSLSGTVACYRVATVLTNVENEVCHPFREMQAACRERRVVARDIPPQCLAEKGGWQGTSHPSALCIKNKTPVYKQLHRGRDDYVEEETNTKERAPRLD